MVSQNFDLGPKVDSNLYLYDMTGCNISQKFNLAPFRKVVNENNSVFPIHGLERTHDVHHDFLPRFFRWQGQGKWCLVRPGGFVTRGTQVAISDQVFNLFVESGPSVVLSSCVAHLNFSVGMTPFIMSDTSAIHMSSSVKSSSRDCRSNRDMQSAAVLFTPRMYWMSKLYSNTTAD